MRLTQIAKSVALAGMLVTVAMPGFAQEEPQRGDGSDQSGQ